MRKIQHDGGSLDDFLRNPNIIPHRHGDESEENKSESAELEKVTPSSDAGPPAAGDVGNRNANGETI